jgi:hypothetical protein
MEGERLVALATQTMHEVQRYYQDAQICKIKFIPKNRKWICHFLIQKDEEVSVSLLDVI